MSSSPPLSWLLYLGGRSIGPITWLGGANLEIGLSGGIENTLREDLAPTLAGPAEQIGARLQAYFAGEGIGKFGIEARPAEAHSGDSYRRNRLPPDLSPAALAAATAEGALTWASAAGAPAGYKAGCLRVDGTETWLTLTDRGGKYLLVVTHGTTMVEAPLEQGRGWLWKSPLAKLWDAVTAAAAAR